jgi:D-glycero-alpha-D-manno-heptose-7-phosphate kinase
VKSILQYKDIQQGVEIHHDGDLPARTGLGSSSSFTVGLLHAIYALKGIMPTKINLATEAIHFEKDILKENVGAQDQVLVSIGGFNKVEFRNDGSFHITPITIAKETLNQLQEHCLLYFSGFSRYASEIAKKQIENTGSKKSELTAMQQMVEEAIKILHSKGSAMKDFGELLHESWKLKRSLTDSIATPRIDEIYEAAISAGAMGGKLLGAGGGGFMLFFASPEVHPKIEQRLSDLLRVPFRFEKNGSQVIFYEPNA